MFEVKITITEQSDGIKVDIDFLHNSKTAEIEQQVGEIIMEHTQEFLNGIFKAVITDPAPESVPMAVAQ